MHSFSVQDTLTQCVVAALQGALAQCRELRLRSGRGLLRGGLAAARRISRRVGGLQLLLQAGDLATRRRSRAVLLRLLGGCHAFPLCVSRFGLCAVGNHSQCTDLTT